MRRQCIHLWMDRFEALKDGCYFAGDFIDKALVQFCFTSVVQVCTRSLNSLSTYKYIRSAPFNSIILFKAIASFYDVMYATHARTLMLI